MEPYRSVLCPLSEQNCVKVWDEGLDLFSDQVRKLEGFPGGAEVKNLPADEGDTRVVGPIPGSGRSPGGEGGNLLQYSCLGNPGKRSWDLPGLQRVGHNLATEHSLTQGS